jgi:hypothetical protein
MAAATAAFADWPMALCAMSDWDSVSSIFEPAAVLPLAFLESCSRGSSWQRWPILRLIHLVQGLSYPKQKAKRRSIFVFALAHIHTVQHRRRAVQLQHDIPALGRLGGHEEREEKRKKKRKKKGLTYEVACHMLWQSRRTVLAICAGTQCPLPKGPAACVPPGTLLL